MNRAEPGVAFVAATRWPGAMPSSHRSASIAASIARTGTRVQLIVASAQAGFDGRGADGLAVLREEYAIEPPPTLSVTVLPYPEGRWGHRGLFYWRAGLVLRRLARSGRIDAVIGREPQILPWLRRWRRWGLLALYESHDYYYDLSGRDDARARRHQRYHRLERRHLPQLDGIIAHHEPQAELYRKALPKLPTLATLPGVDEAFAPDPDRPQRRKIGFLGSLVGRSGFEELLAAFARLDAPGWELLVVGGRTQGERDRFAAAARRAGLEPNRYEISGWLDVETMRARLREVAFATLPLRDSFFNRYLTAPSKLSDYLSLAIPVVMSDLPCLRAMVPEEVGAFVPPGDVLALAEAMQRFIDDPAAQRSAAEAMHDRARELSWDRRGQDVLRFVRECLEARSDGVL